MNEQEQITKNAIVELLRKHEGVRSTDWDQYGAIREIVRSALKEIGVDGLHGCPLCCS